MLCLRVEMGCGIFLLNWAGFGFTSTCYEVILSEGRGFEMWKREPCRWVVAPGWEFVEMYLK